MTSHVEIRTLSRTLLVALFAAIVLLAGCFQPSDPDAGDDNIVADPVADLAGIEVTRAPATASPGQSVIVCWELLGQGQASHTDVHWDNESHTSVDPADPQTGYDGGFSYPANATTQDPNGYEVPRHYCTTIVVEDETVYWRAHAVVSEAPGLLSEEQVITVTAG